MLPAFAQNTEGLSPAIVKRSGGRDRSASGAFAYGDTVTFEVRIPRRLGASGVVMRIRRDTMASGEEAEDPSPRDLVFDFADTDFITDVYALSVDTASLCVGQGLFYYGFLFLRGFDTLFSDAVSNSVCALKTSPGTEFSLLVYEKDFRTPHTGSGIMYHVFVDRFFRGEGKCEYREGARLHKSLGEEPDFARIRGGKIDNNDFFGGNLFGVTEKLGYLESLGVTMIYLSPIFLSPSNHKYDTSDYGKIDEGFGGEAAFRGLLENARARGMKVILDGVFNHTGSDSVYFDSGHRYGPGAASEDSPYRGWFRFGDEYRCGYEAWWDIDILPRLRTDREEVESFFTAPDGIGGKYPAMGTGGWRLDVADELPDAFLEKLRSTVKAVDPEAVIIGEVWENAADKIAYGKRRRYFRGRELDSVMNYPLREALLRFGGSGDAEHLASVLTELYSSYPKCVCDCLMNVIGTHDTVRALSFLGNPDKCVSDSAESENAVQAASRLTAEEYALGVRRLKAVSVIQYTVYGFPCVYYGDEAGAEGLLDPFCRRPMRWDGRADADLLGHYRTLGRLRRSEPCFDGGDFRIVSAHDGYIEYVRKKNGRRLTVAVNCGKEAVKCRARGTELFTGERVSGKTIDPCGFAVIVSENKK
ncbi:MAG: glycoside hydrolase family 13 protein [Clostridia bacterium]|nr:glycoside hydrolase family 13 protein [Clostridia bacterium]